MADTVCETLVELCGSMRRYAVAFDPSALSEVEADAVVGAAGAIARMASAIKAVAAARSADAAIWKAGSHRSAAHHAPPAAA